MIFRCFDGTDQIAKKFRAIFEQSFSQAFFEPLSVALRLGPGTAIYLMEGFLEKGFGLLVFFFGDRFEEFFFEGSMTPPR